MRSKDGSAANGQKKGFLRKAVCQTLIRSAEHGIGKSAAALTYYLLFAMFPLLIFISNLLGLLELNVDSITTTLLPIMPDDVVYLLEAYLNHVDDTSSQVLLWFSLAFSVWFPLRAVQSLMDDVRGAYQLKKPEKPVRYAIRQVLFTIAFLVIVVLTLVISVFGRRFIFTVTQWLGLDQILPLSPSLLNLWQYLRFILLCVLMFAVLVLLYTVAQDKRSSIKSLMPGITLSLVAWLVISIGFSVYVENFGSYSVIYGTLGTVIVLLVWLYMTSFILILGAEFNAALIAVREERREDPRNE